MRRLLASAWFPFVTSLLLALAVTGSYAWMQPDGSVIGNSEMVKYATLGGWAAGAVWGMLAWIIQLILNLIRRIFRVRRVGLLHPVVALAGVVPLLIFGWNIAGEPRYTPVAGAIIDFAARPLLLGSIVTVLFILLCSLTYLFPSRK